MGIEFSLWLRERAIMKTRQAAALFASRRIAAIWALLLLPAPALAGGPVKQEPALPPPACELILGKNVEHLLLLDEKGQSVVYERRGSSMFLWPGRYVIQEIQLQGGYSARGNGGPAYRLTLARGKPGRFDVGTSLQPTVGVKRAGRLLRLDYLLLDADGRRYRGGNAKDPPRFAVYQGENKIASGAFEYG
jgi:hypothetical protein